ncbi:MAG: HEAT repeat domain-containing protein [Planctomycetota bacterium]|nr:MAG: HEAT repeat domain-containing protein [Planctomycetota bacterium]
MRSLTLPLLLLLAGCSSWEPVRRYDRWTLYEERASEVSPEAFEAAFNPAFEAVEAALGPFERRVHVHAWNGAVSLDGAQRGSIRRDREDAIEDIPGIGPALIQAYHSRGGSGPFAPTGIFIGTADAGTAVHELVHARIAESGRSLPLWFEEGYASILGDGLLVGGRWVVDGLACWPWRELSEERFSDAELTRLLELRASDDATIKENVLVHFLGWAIAFDLYRETGTLDWEVWLDRFDERDTLAEARRRLARTLAPETPIDWCERLADPDPGVRLACAKGMWKLRSEAVFHRLMEALEDERNPEVRVGLAINALAAAGELRLHWRTWRSAERRILRALRDSELPDSAERAAALELYHAYRPDRRGIHGTHGDQAQAALARLARFWEE